MFSKAHRMFSHLLLFCLFALIEFNWIGFDLLHNFKRPSIIHEGVTRLRLTSNALPKHFKCVCAFLSRLPLLKQ